MQQFNYNCKLHLTNYNTWMFGVQTTTEDKKSSEEKLRWKPCKFVSAFPLNHFYHEMCYFTSKRVYQPSSNEVTQVEV